MMANAKFGKLKNAWVLFLALVFAVSIALSGIGFLLAGADDSQKSSEYTGSKVLQFHVDFGEAYNQAGDKQARVSFAKLLGSDRFNFAAGDKVVYEVYTPDLAGGGFSGNAFKPLDADPWAEDWEFFNEKAESWTEISGGREDITWGINAAAGWTEVSATISDTSSLIGKTTDFWMFTYGTTAALENRTADFYYKNFRVLDKDGNVKCYIFNNFAQYTYNPDAYNQCSAGVTATVSIVNDPILAAAPAANSDRRVLKYTLDMGEDYATAKSRVSTILFASPMDNCPDLEAGDIIEYEVYSETAKADETRLAGQINDAAWGSLGNRTVREFNQEVAVGWAQLSYDGSNGATAAADLSQGWTARRLMVPAAADGAAPTTVLEGHKLYHAALYFDSDTARTARYETVYFRNIVIRDSTGKIKCTIFDGTQDATSFMSTVSPIEGALENTQIPATVEVADNPFADNAPVRTAGGEDLRNHIVAKFVSDGTEAAARSAAVSLFGEVEPYTVQAGDKLVYSVSSSVAQAGVGSLDLYFSDNSKLSDTSLADNAGWSVKPTTDIGYYISATNYTNPWVIRTVDLSSLAGKQISQYVAAFDADGALIADIFTVSYADIKIVHQDGTATDVYSSTAASFDPEKVEVLSAENISASATEEPVEFGDTRDAYLTFNYSIDDKTADTNRHFNLSLFGYKVMAPRLEKGDRIYYSIRTNQAGVTAYLDIQTDVTWAGLQTTGTTDQNGVTVNGLSMTPNTWYGRYFDIENSTLFQPVGHWFVAVNVNGAVDFDTLQVSIADVYIEKADGTRFDILNGTNAQVEQGSLDIYGLTSGASIYRSGMDLESAVSTGYQDKASVGEPDKYIQFDYQVRGMGQSSQNRIYNVSLFGAEFTDYVLQAGDVLSYDVNMNAAMTGVGMLDMQVVKAEGDAYHGSWLRDIEAARYNAGSSLTDNYGINYSAAADISRIAVGTWATRSVEIPSEFVGYTVQHLALDLSNASFMQSTLNGFTDVEGDTVRNITVKIGNIKIIHADGTETVLFGEGSDLEFDAEKTMVLQESGDITLDMSAYPKADDPVTPPDDPNNPDPEEPAGGCSSAAYGAGLAVSVVLIAAALAFTAVRIGKKNHEK